MSGTRRLRAIGTLGRFIIVVSGLAAATTIVGQVSGSRSLERYYQNRAYPGAPPLIPHPSPGDSEGSDGCQSCHRLGGYAAIFGGFAPVTPHPQLSQCRQCHVPRNANPLFSKSNFPLGRRALRGRAALPGGPLRMPHLMQMREDCRACHVGPGAIPELRTSHPERENCKQCHVGPSEHSVWERRGNDQ